MARSLSLLTSYGPYQFSALRIGLGVYLAAHFATLIPSAFELYGPLGMLPASYAAPFPSVLSHLGSRASLDGFFVVLLMLALIFALGIERRLSAVVLWYGWACLVSRSSHLLLPQDGYVGWLLLASCLVPGREPLCLGRRSGQFRMPAGIYWGAWWVVAVAYSVSGIFKLASPSWRSGEALRFVLECPFARLGWPRDALLATPKWVLEAATWGTLGLELLFAPLCLNRWTRLAAWSAMVAVHLAILLVVDIASVSAAMLLVHCFILDSSWFGARFAKMLRGSPDAAVAAGRP